MEVLYPSSTFERKSYNCRIKCSTIWMRLATLNTKSIKDSGLFICSNKSTIGSNLSERTEDRIWIDFKGPSKTFNYKLRNRRPSTERASRNLDIVSRNPGLRVRRERSWWVSRLEEKNNSLVSTFLIKRKWII